MKPKFPETGSMGEGSFERPLVDSKIDGDKEIEKIVAEHPEAKEAMEDIELLTVKYLNKDNQFCEGQIFVNKLLANDIYELFNYLISIHFRIEKVVPIQDQAFGSQDAASMQANNSSGMNFRFIEGTKRLSLHAFGFSIDINPKDNPLEYPDGTMNPEGATRDLGNPDVFTADHPVVKWLEERGWEWGGHWTEPYHDNHHFQKPLATEAYKKNLQFSLENNYITQEYYDNALAKAERNFANLKNEKI